MVHSHVQVRHPIHIRRACRRLVYRLLYLPRATRRPTPRPGPSILAKISPSALPTELTLLVLCNLDIKSLLAAESTCPLLYSLVRSNDSLLENVYPSSYIHRKRGNATYRQLTRERYESRRECQERLQWPAEKVGESLLILSIYLESNEQLEEKAQEAIIILQENHSCPISERQEAYATAFMAQKRYEEAKEMYNKIYERNECLPWSTLLTASRWDRFVTDLPPHDGFGSSLAPFVQFIMGQAYLGAAAYGNFPALQELHQRGVPWNYARGKYSATFIACQRGHIQILELLRATGVNILVYSNYLTAAKYVQIQVIKYLASINPPSTEEKEQASKMLQQQTTSS